MLVKQLLKAGSSMLCGAIDAAKPGAVAAYIVLIASTTDPF